MGTNHQSLWEWRDLGSKIARWEVYTSFGHIVLKSLGTRLNATSKAGSENAQHILSWMLPPPQHTHDRPPQPLKFNLIFSDFPSRPPDIYPHAQYQVLLDPKTLKLTDFISSFGYYKVLNCIPP